RAASLLGWYFERRLEERARIRGTYYGGDLRLLGGGGVPLPFEGNRKREYGANLEARVGDLRVFGQFLDQKIAELPRRGFEIETAYRIRLDGLFLVGETPLVDWVQPVVRLSYLDNRFVTPREFQGQSVGWDWTKLDLGVRIGLLRNVDLTAEYAINSTTTITGTGVHPNEALVILRA